MEGHMEGHRARRKGTPHTTGIAKPAAASQWTVRRKPEKGGGAEGAHTNGPSKPKPLSPRRRGPFGL